MKVDRKATQGQRCRKNKHLFLFINNDWLLRNQFQCLNNIRCLSANHIAWKENMWINSWPTIRLELKASKFNAQGMCENCLAANSIL